MNEKDRQSLFMAIRETLCGRFRKIKVDGFAVTYMPVRNVYHFTVRNVGSGADARYAADRIKEVIARFGYEFLRLKYRPQTSGQTLLTFSLAPPLPTEALPLRWQACVFSPVLGEIELTPRVGMARVQHFGLHNYDLFIDAATGESYIYANRVTLLDGPGCYIEHTREIVVDAAKSIPVMVLPTSLVLTGVYRNLTKWMRRTGISGPSRREYKAELRRLIDLEVRKMDPIPAIPWPTIWRRLSRHYRSPSGRHRYVSARSWLNQFEKILNEYVTLEKLLPRAEPE